MPIANEFPRLRCDRRLTSCFRNFDKNVDGKVSVDDFRRAVRFLGIMDTTSLTSHRAGHVTPHAAAKAAADRERWLLCGAPLSQPRPH